MMEEEKIEIKNFRDLDVWKLGIGIKDKIIEELDHEARMLRNLIKRLNT